MILPVCGVLRMEVGVEEEEEEEEEVVVVVLLIFVGLGCLSIEALSYLVEEVVMKNWPFLAHTILA